jgi:hypothetical protein
MVQQIATLPLSVRWPVKWRIFTVDFKITEKSGITWELKIKYSLR